MTDRQNRGLIVDTKKYTKPSGAFELDEAGDPAFVPNLLPPPIRDLYDEETVELLAEAASKVGKLAGRAEDLANSGTLIMVHRRQEAVSGSKIEGTTASMKDFNMSESLRNISERVANRTRLHEVVAYSQALDFAVSGNKKLSLATIKDAHKILMKGVQSGDKTPGKFRTEQNVIRKFQGSDAFVAYVPPPPRELARLLQNLEIFMQAGHHQIPPLIQCAIIHYQFEAIHPFMDGNGRIGRLLLPLVLRDRGIMPKPLLYLGDYFEKHLDQYYGGLLQVSQKSRWKEWIKFFLRAFAAQSDKTMQNIEKFEALRKKYAAKLGQRRAGRNASALIGGLFANPYTDILQAQKLLGVTYPTAKKAVFALVEAGILRQIEAGTAAKAFYAYEIGAVFHEE